MEVIEEVKEERVDFRKQLLQRVSMAQQKKRNLIGDEIIAERQDEDEDLESARKEQQAEQ